MNDNANKFFERFSSKSETVKNAFESFFADFSKLAGNFTAVAVESGKGMQQKAKDSLQNLLASMDFVTRDEFDAVRKMAEKAREENEILRKEIEELKKR